MIDKSALKKRALQLVVEDGHTVAPTLVKEFGLSRQAVSNHLKRLAGQGLIAAEGATRARVWRMVEQVRTTASFQRVGLSEDQVWRQIFAPVVADLAENVRDIWRYGITEMVNNAIDHSNSEAVQVGNARNALYTEAWIADDGEGIFLKIQKALGLFDPREAILELAKGKFTTDPANHSGEGIFFTSKVFDAFDIRSGSLHFLHDDGMEDLLIERPKGAPGTIVLMRLNNDSPRTTKEVFDRFAAPEEYSFAKTIVPVRLAQYEGEKLVSRSQAKRLTLRFERFKTVVLDFDGVDEIGQGFADEVFRVFQAAHPGTQMIPINLTPAVEAMVSRAKANTTPAGLAK